LTRDQGGHASTGELVEAVIEAVVALEDAGENA
jgi:hypothetical protein